MVDELVQVLDAESFFAQSHVSRETMEQLSEYESSLRKWQKSINLVSGSTLKQLWHRHFWDSAQLVGMAPASASKWVDLGSGAGFPGLVIAIMAAERPGFEMHLVESDHRKCVFLQEVIRRTGAPARVHTSRIEAPETVLAIGACDVVTARACAPLGRLLGWAMPYFGSDTVGLFLKGKNVSEELTEARKSWTFNQVDIASRAEAGAIVLKVEHLRHDRDEPE